MHTPPPNDSQRAVRFEALSPLQVAQQSGNSELVEILLEAGAKREGGGLHLTLRRGLSMVRMRSDSSEGSAKSPETTPSKSCLKKSSWDADDETLTVLL